MQIGLVLLYIPISTKCSGDLDIEMFIWLLLLGRDSYIFSSAEHDFRIADFANCNAQIKHINWQEVGDIADWSSG